MSQENVDLMLGGYEAWNRSDLDGMLERMTEDFEFRPLLAFFDLEPVYLGREGFTRFWNVWRGAWESVVIRIERIEELPDGRVLLLVVFEGIGSESGAAVSMSMGHIWTFRDGLAARCDVLEPDEALEAAGLRA
jgi:ketosteroid isomerase-like protein